MHGLDGFDEISLTDRTKVIRRSGEQILSPTDFGFPSVTLAQLKVGETVEESAKILTDILQNKGTEAQTNVVLANAAMAIQTANGNTWAEALAQAKESIEAGKAWHSFKTFFQS